MNRLGNKLTRIPLVFRVVSLYVMAGVPLWAASANGLLMQPEPTHVKPSVVVQRVAPPAPTLKTGAPSTVMVPKLGINLAIIDGTYDSGNDSWTLSDDKAQFATMTDQPNDRAGNTFIYGHNTDAVFAKLSGLQAGDIAEIRTTNNLTFHYVYTGEQVVQPNNTDILNDEPASPRLTLMTCEGIFSQTRRIMYFDFKEVV